jgi:hypothetical protein
LVTPPKISKHPKLGMFTYQHGFSKRAVWYEVHNFNGAVNHQLNHFVHGGINRLYSYGKWMNMAHL